MEGMTNRMNDLVYGLMAKGTTLGAEGGIFAPIENMIKDFTAEWTDFGKILLIGIVTVVVFSVFVAMIMAFRKQSYGQGFALLGTVFLMAIVAYSAYSAIFGAAEKVGENADKNLKNNGLMLLSLAPAYYAVRKQQLKEKLSA